MKNTVTDGELQDIRAMLEEIRADIRKMIAAPSLCKIGSKTSDEKVLNVLINQLTEDIDTGLEKCMVRKCGMRETCKSVFTDLLQKSAHLVGSDKVSEEQIRKYHSELERRRAGASKSQCVICFGEVSDLLDKHIRIVRSMNLYHTNDEIRTEVSRIQEDYTVKKILEPVSNKQRLRILKMLSEQSRSFSYLSEHSGLRGGNLLFHLQRLIDANMIIQHHERGDYLLTEKGYTVLKGVVEIMMALNEISTNDESAAQMTKGRDSVTSNELKITAPSA